MTKTLELFAEELLSSGFSVLPTLQDKRPAIPSWKGLTARPMTLEFAEEIFKKKDTAGIGLICGAISGGIECVDFDAHNNDITEIFRQFMADDGIKAIVQNNHIYIEKTPSGGFHILYKFETTETRAGSLKLANWEDGTSMIETRGSNSYVIIAPTPGYETIKGEIIKLTEISLEERNYIIDTARIFTKEEISKTTDQNQNDENHEFVDPVDWYNFEKADAAKMILRDAGWQYINTDKKTGIENWRRPGKTDGTSATWNYKFNAFYVFTQSDQNFKALKYYTPFQILTILKFKRNYRHAQAYVETKYIQPTNDYIRVGVDYYKKIIKRDRYGTEQIELKPWKKDEIKQDHGPRLLQEIPLYDDFTIVPDNKEFQPVFENCFNLYKPFIHKPSSTPGEFRWTKILLNHVFGEQIALGTRYMQALYLYPKKALPILVLVSRERQTGKTTFINWLNAIFGNNMANINPEDLTSQFNGAYANSNIIAVEETLIEKSVTVEKLKALATGKFISVNNKFVNPYKVPFFGKIILASNNEDKFAKIEDEEIRFFVRKLEAPKHANHNIEEDMIREIPAFLNYLETLPPIDWSKDRSGFTPQELQNDSLLNVKKESKSWLFKELNEYISEHFMNDGAGDEFFFATPTDIKTKWFDKNHKAEIPYIITVLRNEMKLSPSDKIIRYTPINLKFGPYSTRVGKPYKFLNPIKESESFPEPEGGDVPF